MPKEVELDVSLELIDEEEANEGENEVGNVKAWVTDGDDQTLGGATLSIVSEDGSLSRAVDTNSFTGKAVIEGVPIQVYNVTITAESDEEGKTYSTFEATVGPGTDHEFQAT